MLNHLCTLILNHSNPPRKRRKKRYEGPVCEEEFFSLTNLAKEWLMRTKQWRDSHYPLGDHFINSSNLFSLLCFDVTRRKLMLIILGTERVKGCICISTPPRHTSVWGVTWTSRNPRNSLTHYRLYYPRSQLTEAISIALGSSPLLLTRIAQTGLGTRQRLYSFSGWDNVL